VAAPNPPRVRITTGSGNVHVVGEARDDVDIDGATGHTTDDETRIDGGSESVTVRVPVGTAVFVGSASGDVILEGSLGTVGVTTDSGSVEAATVTSIDARTRSGKLTVQTCLGPVRMKSRSSRVRVGAVGGSAHISTTSGRIAIEEARGGVSATTVSGKIDVVVTGRDDVRVETVSGRIRISVPAGVKPAIRHRSVSGKRHIELQTGDDLTITARSVSGEVTVGVA
jgi:DUF4097 and DUF4098 domain-containing protein YvlB